MNKKLNNKYQAILLAVLITCLVRLLFLVIAKTSYENGDDQQIANYIYSYYGNYQGYILFINIIWEVFLTKLSSLIPGIPWYGMIQLFLIEICTIIVNYLVIKKLDKKAFVPLLLFYLCFGYQLFVRVQFTKTAAICSIVGIIWMYEIYENKEPIITNIFAGLLVLIGSLIRFNSFEMACLIVFIIGLKHLLQVRSMKQFMKLCLPFVVVFSCVFACRFYNLNYFSKDDLAQYRTFSSLRSTVLDDGVVDYKENEEAFNDLGISEVEYNLLYNWEFVDQNVFDSNLFENVKNLRTDITSFSVSLFVNSAFKVIRQYILYIFASILLFFIGFNKSEHRLLFFVETCAVIGTEIYLVATGRYLLNRLQFSIFLGYFLILVLYAFDTFSTKYRKTIQICLIGALALSGYSLVNSKKSQKNEYEIHRQYDEVEKCFIEDKQHTYFTMGRGNLVLCDEYGVYERFEKNHFSNVMKITSWDANSPSMKQRLIDLGIHNFYEDIIDNPNYYLARPGDLENEIAYIRKHYNANAQAILVKDINDYKVYRIVSRELILKENEINDVTCQYDYLIDGNEVNGHIDDHDSSDVYVGIESDNGEINYYYTTIDGKGNFSGKIDSKGIVHLYIQNGKEIQRVV